MGRIFVVELDGRSYRCKFCRTHLTLPEDLVSRETCILDNRDWIDCILPVSFSYNSVHIKGKASSLQAFQCRRGKAYLFNNVVNITVGASEERLMLSGMHTVADIFCCSCGQNVGWKYESAHEKSQKFKEGKFVLERGRIVVEIDFSTDVYLDNRPSVSDAEE